MTRAGEQNHLDLAEIVNEVNRVFAGSASFVFLPGDVADDGSRTAYAVVREELDHLNVPWCAIVGDHDVHEKSFANFLETMSERTHYAFTIGSVRFVAMNAFDVPHPGSFTASAEQLAWVKGELQTAAHAGQTKVLLLHCYPSDLKVGAAELMELLRNFDVSLIDSLRATAHLDGHDVPMERVKKSQVWEAHLSIPHEGVYSLVVSAEDSHGKVATDEIRVVSGDIAGTRAR
jgi:Icc protein